jgi:hypothetical protein
VFRISASNILTKEIRKVLKANPGACSDTLENVVVLKGNDDSKHGI